MVDEGDVENQNFTSIEYPLTRMYITSFYQLPFITESRHGFLRFKPRTTLRKEQKEDER